MDSQCTGLGEVDYASRLRRLNLFLVQGRLLRADMIKCWNIFHGKSTIRPTDLWKLDTARSSSTRGHMFKIQHERCQVDARGRFFSVRVIRDWNSLPASTVGADNLNRFKASLAEALGERLFEFIQ